MVAINQNILERPKESKIPISEPSIYGQGRHLSHLPSYQKSWLQSVAINQNILEKPKESKILISEPSIYGQGLGPGALPLP